MYEYGVKHDIERLHQILIRGGQHLCKLDKMPEGHLIGFEESRICDIDMPLASTITARYYKGIGSHKDNMVIEIYEE